MNGKGFYPSGVIVLFCGVRRGIVLQVPVNRLVLVLWHGKYIAKSATTVGALLASALGFVHCRVRIDLRCPNSSNKRAGCWESRAESSSIGLWITYSAMRHFYEHTHVPHLPLASKHRLFRPATPESPEPYKTVVPINPSLPYS
jgi:hypothetical protein